MRNDLCPTILHPLKLSPTFFLKSKGHSGDTDLTSPKITCKCIYMGNNPLKPVRAGNKRFERFSFLVGSVWDALLWVSYNDQLANLYMIVIMVLGHCSMSCCLSQQGLCASSNNVHSGWITEHEKVLCFSTAMSDVSPAAFFGPRSFLTCTFLHFECSADRPPQSALQ